MEAFYFKKNISMEYECEGEFGAFKPVSVSVLSFDNSFKTGFKTGYSLVLQKQIDSFKSVSFLKWLKK